MKTETDKGLENIERWKTGMALLRSQLERSDIAGSTIGPETWLLTCEKYQLTATDIMIACCQIEKGRLK